MRATLAFLLAVPALAQFSGLATTTDGSQLYFSSPLQLAGSSDVSSDPKIFRWDGSNFSLFAHIAKVASAPPNPLPGQYAIYSNFYSLRRPLVSGSGAVTGYVGYADCVGCTYTRVLAAQTTFQFAGAIGALTLPYACDVSANARYALCQTRTTPGNPSPCVLVDLAEFTQSPGIATDCAGSPHCVTSTGVVLLSTQGPVSLWSAAGAKTLPIGASSVIPMISDDGSLIVHGIYYEPLAIYNVATGVDTPLLPFLVRNGGTDVSLFSISNDARWVLANVYHNSGGALTLIDSSNGIATQLVPTEHVQTATLSGDGKIAYAVTTSGKLLKIDTQSGVSQQITASQPIITSIDGAPSPGSLNRILGSGLAGTQVMLNGSAIAVIASSASEIDLQIPWGTPAGNATLQIIPAAQVPFQQMWPLQIQDFKPTQESQAIHQDFSGFIDPSSPALGGEVVSYYFTGLGPVSPAAVDGKTAGSNPLSLVTTPLNLVGDGGQDPVSMAYAGLAPGTIGLYQVSIQLPAHVARTNKFLPGGPNLFSLSLNGIDLSVWALPN